MLHLRAEVDLNDLTPADVDVSAVYGSVDEDDRLIDVQSVSLSPIDLADGASRYGGDIPLERTGSFGYTVRVLPKNELLTTPGELGLIASA